MPALPRRRSPLPARVRWARTAAVVLWGAAVLAGTAVSPAPARAGGAPAPGAVPSGRALPVAPLGSSGRWITDAQGRVVMLRGLNMVDKVAPYYPAQDTNGFGDADIAFLEKDGFDVVRLGVLFQGLEPTPGHIDPAYLDHVADTVADLSAHHIFTLLDFHQDDYSNVFNSSDGFPDWMTVTHGATNNKNSYFPLEYVENPGLQAAFDSFWANDPGPNGVGLQTDAVDMISLVAAKFAHDPDVLGYDIFNEPWPGTNWSSCLGAAGCTAETTRELVPFYRRALAAVRAHDSMHLVLFEPFVTFNFGMSPVSLPSFGPGTGLAFHQYATTVPDEHGVVSHALTWSARTGRPLMATEFGATTDPASLDRMVAELDDALVPWAEWSFDGGFLKTMAEPASAANSNPAVDLALDGPHPIVVAGVPASSTFVPGPTAAPGAPSGTFQFTYTTARPQGGSYPSGTVSSFWTSPGYYPGGYTALVTGGRVTSAPCSTTLTVVALAKSPTVSLTVRPGGRCPAS